MSDDVVKRLRTWSEVINETSERVRVTMLHGRIFTEAADEIERLRKAGDRIAMHLDAHYGMGNDAPVWLADDLAEWKEARRG